MRRRRLQLVSSVVFVVALAACTTTGLTQRPVATPAVAQPQPAAPQPEHPPQVPASPDPAVTLIKTSQAHFDAGQRELELGHLGRARTEFNLALDVLLEHPGGARTDSRVQEHFDRLVERISAYEIRALMQGDGFAEQPDLPASLDQLLAMSSTELPPPNPELKGTVESDLRATAHDIPIPLSPKVLTYIELFQGRLRDWFQAALLRGVPHLPMIQAALRAEGLPLDLAFVPIVESAFHTNATSRAKAKGFWQLMRGTAVEQGLKHDWYIDERSNPERATAAAARYFRVLNKMFGGDWHLTLASYNFGPGKIQRAIKRTGVSDYWALAAKNRALPRETRDYVPMVLAVIVVARNPAQYGFVVDADVAPSRAASESVELAGPVDLRRIAEWAGVPVDEIQRLNPELRRLTTPLRAPGYRIRVPAGTADAVTAQLAATSPEDWVALQYHAVKRGETIASIATKLRVRRADLAEANYLTLRSKVRPGDRLVIPRVPTTLLAARADGAGSASARHTDADSTSTSSSAARTERGKVVYKVRRGDTLSSIARAHATTVEAIRSWNGLRGSKITAGDRLTLFAPTRQTRQQR